MKNRYFALLVFLLIGYVSNAQEDAIYTTKNGAIQGYDPVAYFKDGSPVKGNKEISTTWMGAKWFFSSNENLNLFESDPEKYAPQYGGYCAYGVAKGGLYKTEPEAWKIVDGKLYLNYSLKIQKDWEEDISGFIVSADKKWPELKADQ